MAYSVSPIGAPLGTVVATDTGLGHTGDMNVRGGATNLYYLDCDNTANSAASYLKLWDATAPTVGTTAPDWIFKIPANTRLPIPFPQGVLFATGFSMAAVTTGGTAGVTDPVSAFIVRATLS